MAFDIEILFLSMIFDYEQLKCLHINENNERQSLGIGPFWSNKWYRLFINMQICVQIYKSVDNNIAHLFEQYGHAKLHFYVLPMF